MKKLLSLLLALTIILSLCACGKQSDKGTEDNTENSTPTNNESSAPNDNETQQQETLVDYTLTIKNKADYALKDVKFSIHSADGQTVYEGVTDTTGNANIQLDKNGEYIIRLTDVPVGYLTEDEYYFENQSAELVLASKVITDNAPSNLWGYRLGNVVYDFSVITSDGERFVLSEVLKSKKAVLMYVYYDRVYNFNPSMEALNTAYSAYEDEVAVLSINANSDIRKEDEIEIDILELKDTLGITYDMTTYNKVVEYLSDSIGAGYPQIFIIDRYGVFCVAHIGADVTVEIFQNAFRFFTSENYTQQLFYDLEEIPQGVAPEECPGHSIVDCTIVSTASCTEAGIRKGYCKYCSVEMEEEYFAEHNYSFGVCVDCGKKESEE